MTKRTKAAQEARKQTVTVRVTRREKRELQRLAKEKRESVSALLMRCAQGACDLTPREERGEAEVVTFYATGEAGYEEAQAAEQREPPRVVIKLSPECEKWAE